MDTFNTTEVIVYKFSVQTLYSQIPCFQISKTHKSSTRESSSCSNITTAARVKTTYPQELILAFPNRKQSIQSSKQRA
ncbi:hypothetical protein BVRB_6g135880 [Beta vulgaris subsp. vulgaris]|nr:hypothetical protein BVRB_6g135880 [Beta vulgaris subsp. vulgaris]